MEQSAHVNLNHMICPAVLDPFQGGNYRLIACLHQAFLCSFVSKFLIYMFGQTIGDDNVNDDCNNKSTENIDDMGKCSMTLSSTQTNQNVAGNSKYSGENHWNTDGDNNAGFPTNNSNSADDPSTKKTT